MTPGLTTSSSYRFRARHQQEELRPHGSTLIPLLTLRPAGSPLCLLTAHTHFRLSASSQKASFNWVCAFGQNHTSAQAFQIPNMLLTRVNPTPSALEHCCHCHLSKLSGSSAPSSPKSFCFGYFIMNELFVPIITRRK